MSSRASEATPSLDVEHLAQQALQLFGLKQWEKSLRFFDQVAELRPGDAQIHNYRARACESLERHEDALLCLDQALAIDPSNTADLRNRAIVLTKLGRLSEAVGAYDAALRGRKDNSDLLVRRAMVLNQVDRREEALVDAERAASLRPNDLEILNALVIILDNLGRYIDALKIIDRMLGLDRNYLDAINNSGMLLARLGRFKEALACYDRSLAQRSDQAQAFYNRSLIRLALGDWIRGFQEFESRWETIPLKAARLQGLGPLWLGGDEDLLGKTLLVYHEQGYGDTLQCVRYVPLLAKRGAKIILAVPPALALLMRSLEGVADICIGDRPFPHHDYQCPLMSLPLAFRTTPDTVPVPAPYLRAIDSKVAQWKHRLGTQDGARIGLAWSGRRYAPINYPRDVALAALRPLLSLDAHFISLQKEIDAPDRSVLQQFPNLCTFDEALEDFADTAALIENVDLVIAVDSAVAHLAGALGKPVWLLNRYAACWRWLQEGVESPWYPTLRQFRQSTVGDWTSVVTEVTRAASSFIESRDSWNSREAHHRPGSVAPTPRVLAPKATHLDKIRFVSGTRLSTEEFFAKAPLGRSLPIYRTFPKRQVIELRLFPNNREGLSSIYNTAIEESRADPALLIFIHDDVYLSDYYWVEHLCEALRHFDLVGLAGNRRRVPRQASWMYLDGQFTRDNYDNLSGVLGHGNPFPDLRQLSVYGEPGQEVKLLDGVMMAIRSQILLERELRFDPQFTFDFYDLDFCRQAELRGIRMGTWAISMVHASAGALGVDRWRAAYRDYLAKYGES